LSRKKKLTKGAKESAGNFNAVINSFTIRIN
jgi:hypothetical protein